MYRFPCSIFIESTSYWLLCFGIKMNGYLYCTFSLFSRFFYICFGVFFLILFTIMYNWNFEKRTFTNQLLFQILSARAHLVCRIERKWIQIILWLRRGWPILILTGNHLNFESLTSSTSNRSNCWEAFWSWRSSGSKEQAKWKREVNEIGSLKCIKIIPKALASHSKEGSTLSNIKDWTTSW